MGNPRYVYGVSYQVGTCRTQGFSARPSGYSCSVSVFASQASLSTLTSSTVRKQDPKLLRQRRPVLLHRQRCKRPPRLRPSVRSGRSHFHQEQAQQRLRQWNDYYRKAYYDYGWFRQPADYHRSVWWQLLGEVGTVWRSRVSVLRFVMVLEPLANEIVRWTGPTCCQSGSTCKASNQYYSQCQ